MQMVTKDRLCLGPSWLYMKVAFMRKVALALLFLMLCRQVSSVKGGKEF